MRSVDEILEFIEGRYLSASEACWRILQFPMYRQSPAVRSVDVHMPGEGGNERGFTWLEKYLARPMATPALRAVFEKLTFAEFHERFVCHTPNTRDRQPMDADDGDACDDDEAGSDTGMEWHDVLSLIHI